jgi:hypothetical protein
MYQGLWWPCAARQALNRPSTAPISRILLSQVPRFVRRWMKPGSAEFYGCSKLAPAWLPSTVHSSVARAKGLFVLIATVITISSALSTVMSVHLLSLLQARGLALSVAVAFGALVGPSQVGARTLEMFAARFHHPIWTKLASTSLVALGIVLILVGFLVISAALALYGAGIGLESIARGTLPLAVFGAADHPAIMGRIARPSLVAQAVAPTIAAGLIDASGFDGMLAGLAVTAITSALLSVALWYLLKHAPQTWAT